MGYSKNAANAPNSSGCASGVTYSRIVKNILILVFVLLGIGGAEIAFVGAYKAHQEYLRRGEPEGGDLLSMPVDDSRSRNSMLAG